MSKRNETAIEVLKNGGFFRKALERNYHGGETFVTRLRDAQGRVVKGVGCKTLWELQDAGLIQSRPCCSGSTFPQEWELRAERVAA